MIKLYHSTTTGKNNETISSFKSGACSDLSEGYGQGKGFYVWTMPELARFHLSFLEKEGFLENQGNPLIVECEAQTPLNPLSWNIDYEVHASLLAQFLKDNSELVKKLPDNSIQTERGFLQPSRSSFSQYNTLIFRFSNNSTKAFLTNTSGDTGTAHILGAVFDAVHQSFPNEATHAKCGWFSDLTKITALKYTGVTPLPVTGYEVLS